MKTRQYFTRRLTALCMTQAFLLTPAFATDGPPCNPATLRTAQMFNCSMPENLDAMLAFKAATTLSLIHI